MGTYVRLFTYEELVRDRTQIRDMANYEAPEPWVTKAELARYLGMSERWIELQGKAGLPSVRFGRCRRYRISDVERWLLAVH